MATPEGWGKGDKVNVRASAAFGSDRDVVPVTHDRAEAAARRLIGSHFGLADRPKITVPARKHEDDDFVLMAYIRQQRGKDETDSEEVDCDA